ncbi:MAG: FtsX-like permease family protein, partial [Candidatus Odinarchaeota archaeon]
MVILTKRAVILFYSFKISIRTFSVSLISLIIALSLLTGSIYYTEASRNDLYLAILKEAESTTNGEVEFFTETLTTESIMPNKELLETEISKNGLERVYEPVPFYPTSFIDRLVIYGKNVKRELMFSGHYGLNESILSECKAGSRFPTNASEILVFAPDNSSIAINDEIKIIFTHDVGYNTQGDLVGVSKEFELTVAGIITESSMSSDSVFRELLPYEDYGYFTSLELFLELAQEKLVPDLGLIQIRTYYRFNYDTSSISSLKAVEITNAILAMEQTVTETSTLRTMGVSSELRPSKNDTEFFLSLFGLLTVPILILLLLFVIYSFGISNSNRLKYLESMRSRGNSGRYILLTFLIVTAAITITAVIISALVGIPVAVFMGMTSGFLAFTSNVTAGNYLQVINPVVLQKVVLVGIGIAVLSYFPAIVLLYRSKETISEKEAIREKKQRFHLRSSFAGIFLLLSGFAGLIIVRIFNWLFTIIPEEVDVSELYSLFAPLISILMLFSPLFILIGALLLINKIIIIAFPLLSRFFWKMDQKLMLTATRMLSVNIKFTARTSMVMAMAMSFLVILSFLPQTAVIYNEESAYYENGSDIIIKLGRSSEEEIDSVITAFENISELVTTKVIYSKLNFTERYYGSYLLRGAGIFLGIQSNFASTAYWKDNYGESLETLVSTLYEQDFQEKSLELPAIVDQHTLELLEVNGDEMQIASRPGSAYWYYKIKIFPQAISEYFPALYRKPSISQEGHYVCRYSFLANLNESTGSSFSSEREIWGKITAKTDSIAMIEQVKEILAGMGYSEDIVVTVQEEVAKKESSLSVRLLWVVVNYNLLGGLTVLLAVIVLFLFARSSQNETEIGFSRALGMKFHQILFLKITESVLLFLISSISGLIIGFLLIGLFTPIISEGIARGPPLVFYLDIPVFIVIYFLILLMMCLSGLVSALAIIRRDSLAMMKEERVDFFSKGLYRHNQIEQEKTLHTGKRKVRFSKLLLIKHRLTAGLQLSRSNMRLFIGSLLGLVIALSMLTGCLYYIEFSRPELYLDYFEEEGYDFLEFRSWSSLGGGKTVEEIMEQDQFLDQEVDQHGLGQLLQKTPLSTSSAIQERTRFDGQENRQVIRGYQGLDEPLLAEAVTGSRLPANRSEVLVVAPASSNLTLNQSITVNIVYSKGLEEVEYQLNLTVTGMYTSQTLGDGSLLREIFPVDEYHFILPLKYFIPLVQAVDQDLTDAGEEKTLDLINLFMYGINYETIDRSEAVGSVETLIAFLNEMKTLRNSGKTALQIDGVFLSGFSAWTLGIYIFMIQFLIISIPVFVLVAVMVFFSLGIINEKRLKAVELLRNKGFSGRFVFAVLFLETVLIAILATVIALVAGLPLALVMGTT